MTAGRYALLAVLQRTSARFVAGRCNVDPSVVSRWASGDSTPSQTMRNRLAEVYGIAPASWDAPRAVRRLLSGGRR
jgi:transcriptional regulator with XRE-family HTH domain